MACDDRLALIPFGFGSDVHIMVPKPWNHVDRLE